MMKKSLLIIVVLIVAVIAAVFLLDDESDNVQEAVTSSQMPAPGTAGVPEQVVNTGGAQIVYTDSGFSPNPMTVKRGETATLVNQSSNPFWPASAMHPTHKVYPGSDIEKCGTAEESKIFDACRGIQPGGSWSYVFNEVGSWNYHDHLNTKNFGKIIVE